MPLKLNYHISLRDIRGEKDNDLTNCYGKNCKNISDAQRRTICKEECHQNILNEALSKLSGLIAKCQYAEHPSPCRQAVASLMKTYRNRIETSKGRMRDAKVELIADRAIKRRRT